MTGIIKLVLIDLKHTRIIRDVCLYKLYLIFARRGYRSVPVPTVTIRDSGTNLLMA